MEIIGGGSKNSKLENAAFATNVMQEIMSVADSSAASVYISKDNSFNNLGTYTQDQYLESLKPFFYLENIRQDSRAAFPSREKIIVITAKNIGSWGGHGTVNDIAQNTLLKSHFLVATVARIECETKKLPSLASHLGTYTGKQMYILLKTANKAATTATNGIKTAGINMWLSLRVAFVKAGVELPIGYSGIDHKNRVRYSKLPGLKAGKVLRSFYNGNHSKVEIMRNDQLVAFGNLDERQYKSFEENLNGRFLVDVCEDRHQCPTGTLDCGKSIVTLTNTGSASVRDFSDKITEMNKVFNSYNRSAPISGTYRYKEDYGLDAPKLAHDESQLPIVFGDYISREATRTIASSSYGRTVHDITVNYEDRNKMFYRAPNDVDIRVVCKLSISPVEGGALEPKLAYQADVPYVDNTAKINGGEITSLKLINRYVEMHTSYNDILNDSATIDRAEIFRSGSQSYTSGTASVTYSIGSHGLLTTSITISATQPAYEDTDRAAADTWYKAGIVTIHPLIKTWHDISTYAPSAKANEDMFKDATKVPATNSLTEADVPGKDNDAKAMLSSIFDTTRFECINIKQRVDGYKVKAAPAITTLSQSMATNEFLPTINVAILKMLEFFNPSPTCELMDNRYIVNISVDGHDPKHGNRGGANTSRVPSVPTRLDFASNVKSSPAQIVIDSCHSTVNYQITTQNTQHMLMT